jgi:hypothetical protein
MKTSRKPRGGTRVEGTRKHRSRPVPKWLLKSQDLDAFARSRCLLVLSVLSGEQAVTDAIRQAKLSRPAYYKLETRALQAMLTALNPLAARPVRAQSEATGVARRIEGLEARVTVLLQEKRRAERLLMLTRKSLRMPALKGRRGRPPKDPALIPNSKWRSLSLKGKTALSAASMPTTDGAAGS